MIFFSIVGLHIFARISPSWGWFFVKFFFVKFGFFWPHFWIFTLTFCQALIFWLEYLHFGPDLCQFFHMNYVKFSAYFLHFGPDLWPVFKWISIELIFSGQFGPISGFLRWLFARFWYFCWNICILDLIYVNFFTWTMSNFWHILSPFWTRFVADFEMNFHCVDFFRAKKNLPPLPPPPPAITLLVRLCHMSLLKEEEYD